VTGPRYVLATVTGYPINISRHYAVRSETKKGEGLSVAVLDRAYCHREVAVFDNRSNGASGREAGAMTRATALKRATALCDRLNRLEDARGAEEAA
jgi:hypothetical protein